MYQVTVIFLCYLTTYGHGKNLTSKERLWNKLLINYSKAEAPSSVYSTRVRIGVYVNSFFSISEVDMDYSISFYLRQAWNDPRLTFDPIEGHITEVKLPDGSWDQIWVPDVFFRNEKEAAYHSITTANRLLRLKNNGDLWYVSKITARLACPMMLKRYPLDTQACPMMFESFGYTSDTMYLEWLDTPAQVDKGNQIPQFTLKDILRSDCTQNYTGGSFSCLQLDFILARDTGFFLLQVYIPSMMVVILSWVSFYINVEAIPARVSVGLITVLTMTTASASANSSLPRVSYVKAIDVWMTMCLLFVFAALLEYSIVNLISRSSHDKAPNGQQPCGHSGGHSGPYCSSIQLDNYNSTSSNSHLDGHTDHKDARHGQTTPNKAGIFSVSVFKKPWLNNDDPRVKARKKAVAVDRVSRVGFPLCFFIFNLVYWTVYTTKNGLVDN